MLFFSSFEFEGHPVFFHHIDRRILTVLSRYRSSTYKLALSFSSLSLNMAEDIVIDKTLFFDRLSTFYNAWKADKRSGAGVFGGVGSIVILMGKTDEANAFQKANAMHVSLAKFPSSF